MPLTAHRYQVTMDMFLCELCNKNRAWQECEVCGRLYCKDCGVEDDEFLCNDCLEEIEREKEMEAMDEAFLLGCGVL